MHPRSRDCRTGRRRGDGRCRRSSTSCASAVRVHPREVDAHFAHGTRHQLLGRLVERDHAPARGDALSQPAARRRVASAASASTRSTQHDARAGRMRATRACLASTRSWTSSFGSTRRCRRRASPVVCCQRLALRRPAMGRRRERALQRAKSRLAHARVDGIDWYWPADERADEARDGRRSGCWRRSIRSSGIAGASSCSGDGRYRFEAYTPVAKRSARLLRAADAVARSRDRLGQSVGEGRCAPGRLRLRRHEAPRDRAFARELDAELERMRAFLDLSRRRSKTAKSLSGARIATLLSAISSRS